MLVVILSITGRWFIQHLTTYVLSLITEVNVLTLFELCLTSSDRFFTLFEITLKPRPASLTRAGLDREANRNQIGLVSDLRIF